MAKRPTSVWIDPLVLKRVRLLGLMRDQPVGNVVEALLDFTESGKLIADPDFQRRFNALLDTAFANAGRRTTIEGAPENDGFEAGRGPIGDDVEG